MTKKNDFTYFGNKRVSFQEKTAKVRDVFASVASRYDLMNDIMSLGTHRIWKNKFISEVPENAKSLLDVAGGTGDIALKVAKKLADANIIICDLTLAMLEEGRRKAINAGNNSIKFVCGNGENLPFPNASFDCYTIAFGMRNISNIEAAISEAYRVLKPGGKFLCMEFSRVESKLLRRFYDLYSYILIPKFGKYIADDEDSYQYLVESIRKFPKQNEYKKMIKAAGFNRVDYDNLLDGIVAIHYGYR